MASWFSRPINWISTGMELKLQPDNSMVVKRTPGPIEITALYEGFVIYRSTSTAPEKGNLELVLMPDKWPDEIQTFFNPRYPKLAVTSGINELPPGRIVYRDLAKSVIKQSLHKLIFENFKIFAGDETKIHRSLYFVPDDPKAVQLKDKLLEVWKGTPDPGERQKKIDAIIAAAVDEVLTSSLSDTVKHGLPVQGKDVLCTIGDGSPSAEVTFEMRNLYGEPLNPHFYLRKIEKPAGDLTPKPPFSTSDPVEPRFKPTDKFLPIRIPAQGGVEFEGLGGGAYQSLLIWTHQFDSTTGVSTGTTVAARPGVTVDVPVKENAQRVNAIWDTDYFWINKHAEVFQVPCELILATIYKEGAPLAGGSADMHSIRLEPISGLEPYPVDYEDLVAQSQTPGSSLTKATVETFWKLVGLYGTDDKGLPYGTKENKIAADNFPKVPAPFPFDETKPIGTSSKLLKAITWKQLAEMVELKPHLITAVNMKLPVLGKTKTAYHYDLIVSKLGAVVAETYWKVIGGVRKLSTTEEFSKPSPPPLSGYPLPTNKDWEALKDPGDATKKISWEQLLTLLDVLRKNEVKTAPFPTYVLKPLQRLGSYNYPVLFAQAELMRILGVTEVKANQIIDRYFILMGNDVTFVPQVGPAPGVPGVRRVRNPLPETEYLTWDEVKAFSEIFPWRISIGVGQILFETAGKIVIPWIKKHYPKFFTDTVIVDPPPGSEPMEPMVRWLWTNLWENEELQIAFIAAYHKQNASMYWQAAKDRDGNEYKVGETMTRFDFPRSGGAYNATMVRKPRDPRTDAHPDPDWGLHSFGKYFTPFWSAMDFAATRLNSIPATDPKWARVRLRPDLVTNSGMETR